MPCSAQRYFLSPVAVEAGAGLQATDVPNAVGDPASTRDLVGGSPLDVPGSQIAATLDRELRQADTLLAEYHDLDSFLGTIGSNCRGSVCNTRLVGRVSTGDLLEETTEIGGMPVEVDTVYSPVMTYRGVPIA